MASSLIIFGILYFFLHSSVRARDRATVQEELAEFVSFYVTGGTESIERQVNLEKEAHGDGSIFIRLATSRQETLFLSLPDRWMSVDPDFLKTKGTEENRFSIRLRESDEKEVWEMASTILPDRLLLQVGRNMEESEDLLEDFREIFLGILIPIVVLGFTGGAVFASRTLRPIRNLIHTVQSIERGEMGARVLGSGARDELDELVVLFNRMLERIEMLICGMKACLDNVAHDLRTPMTRLRGIAEMTLQSDQEDSATLREALMDCAEESERMGAMLNTLMDISEAETGVMKLDIEETDIASILEDVIALYEIIAEEKNISLNLACCRPITLFADRNRLRQIFANLLDNAVKYTPPGGRVDIEAYRRTERIDVIIRDTGVGIPSEEIPLIWDRLYRGDKSRSQRGLGLGLSTVKAVVQAHKGNVEVFSESGKGSRFIVYLPPDPAVCRIESPACLNLSKV
jgi:signal transduction histidine kinase